MPLHALQLPPGAPTTDSLRLLHEALALSERPAIVTEPQLDPPGPIITYANEAFTQLSGYSLEELRGRTPRILQGPRTERAVLAEMRTRLKAGMSSRGATWNYRRDGSPYYFSMTVLPVHDAEGCLAAFVSCQNALQADEADPFELIFRQAPLGMSVTDAHGRFVRVNPAFAKLCGRSEADLIGRPLEELALPEMREAVRRRHSQTISGSPAEVTAGDLVRPDGSKRRVLVKRGRLERADGTCLLVNSVMDVTDRLNALTARDEAEQRYRDALERMPVLAIGEDRQGRITYCNQFAARTLGWPAEELIGRTVFETLTPHEDRAARQASYEEWMQTGPRGVGSSYESENLTRSGELRRIRWNVSEVVSGKGELEGVICFGHDLTEELRAAEESATNRELIEALLNGTPDLMFLFDSEMRVLKVHGRPNLLVRPAAEMLGRCYLDFSQSSQARETKRLFDLALQTGEMQVLEYPAVVPAGRRHFEARFVPCGAQRGLAIVRDVTHRRALETQLMQAQKMEAIGQLAGGIAHDFNNLLTVMLGGLDLIRLEPSHPDRHLLDVAVESARRAAELTQQLLDYSRQGPLAEEDFDLSEILRDTTRLLGRTFGPRHTLSLELPEEPIPVCGDPRKIRQAVMNLCINARDAIPGDGVVRIGAGLRIAGEVRPPRRIDKPVRAFAWFSVSDNGTGMSPETRQRMFDPFFTTKERGKGTGLGLATVLGVTEQHGGWVECDSQPGAGSEFRIFLPGGGCQAVEAASPTPERPTLKRPDIRCLLVDDEPHVLLTARLMLEREGFRVQPASSANEAFEILSVRRGQIDLIFLDLMMPSLAGDQAIGQLRAIDPRVRIVLMSGGLLTEDDRPPGADGWLAKPFRRQDLVTAAHAALGLAEIET